VNSSALPPLLILLGVLLLAVAWQGARRPVQRRFAVRDVLRRRGESALVVAGSLVGTALIVGSFIVGDTLDASIRQRAWTQLGPIDEVIIVPESGQADEIVSRISSGDEARIDGVMAFTTAAGAVASDAEERATPAAQIIELDFERARDFGGNPGVTGISGSTPGEGEVVVTDALASEIGVRAGDDVVVHLYGERIDLKVDRVVGQEGLAGFWIGEETESLNAFVGPGTLASVTQGGTGNAVAPAAQVVVSNRGDVIEGRP
jgi:putative ABC transport system permease protein